MTEIQHASVLLTRAGRNFDGFAVDAFADRLGLPVQQLVEQHADLAAILASKPLENRPGLFVGSGNVNFDARAASALGIPLLLLIDAPGVHIDLATEECGELGAVVAATFTAEEAETEAGIEKIRAGLNVEAPVVMSAPVFESWLLDQAKAQQSHIVLPEGDDDRILEAAHQLLAQDICELTILGNLETITARAAELGFDLSKAHLQDPATDPNAEKFAADFAELRKKKGVTIEEARETMKDISYYATMMIHEGLADGMVSGAAHTTAHTIKPSFQIIKTAPGTSVVSSIFLMVMRGRLWAFGDCAVNPNPTAEQLAEIAVVSARTAAQFGIDPRVALLSYSTGSSGAGPDVDRSVAAVAKAHELDPELKLDGPLQFDAACDPGVAAKKMPNSEVAGHANVFIFPDLEAGNIGYKTAQRTGHALAVGPILQGLNKPVNDLSRGATVADIVNTVAITAIQAGGK
ncbi:phosphate acetyltransferase [Corynebacterium ulcerans]|uniref:phosphate acetyltransferase n=1 Tax=Corynebacterium ulcerans TaxID=65058 RepID=UPI0013037B44|nr:phosphate acetyltransferase [Corynebacterium ulcerans]MBL4944773.1 phosphate acetyltransferase [Corynebacterium ulcerans]QGZ26240.1 phosphate acetyltransferase [Corynebacterium ulcerans]QOE24933.1 phosphate acetyltransferase [Corynebacterium ulcerans]